MSRYETNELYEKRRDAQICVYSYIYVRVFINICRCDKNHIIAI